MAKLEALEVAGECATAVLPLPFAACFTVLIALLSLSFRSPTNAVATAENAAAFAAAVETALHVGGAAGSL